jgi:hypothetical protein
MHRLLVVLALAGCDVVLGLKEDPPPDTPANGHDEDLDGIGDAEDNCPTITGSQQDSDSDGVGDLCDPNANLANRIAAFYPFDVMPPGWITIAGSWTVENDTLVHKGGASYSKFVAKNGLVLAPPYVIEARFRFDTTPPGGEYSLSAALNDTATDGAFCTILNGALMTEVSAYSPGDAGVTRVPPLDFTVTFTALMMVEATSVTCIMRSDTQGDTAATSNPASVASGPMGLEGRYADSTTDYVIIYTR